jgi:hypothetical protein
MIGGSAMSESTTRWLPESDAPPMYAVTAPHREPRVTPMSTEVSPT